MEKSTKDAWTGSNKNLSPEAKEKRQSINKKILKFGCLPIIIFFVIILIVGAIFSSDSQTGTTLENTNKVIDSVDFKQKQKLKDSLVLIAKLNREKAKKELRSFKKQEDEFEGNIFYRDPRTPYYANVNFIYPYIGQKGDEYWLRVKFQYAASDWLFINSGILLVDGEKYTISGTWERDNNSSIWEWLDIPVGDTERVILRKVANSKSAKIRYIGNQYHSDRVITKKEKSIIRKTLKIYDNLK